jgi:DNA-binding response OmpR family regulator
MKARILYVEDDESLSFITKDQLEMENYSVTHCANGKDGWAMFKKNEFDLCLLDVMLPQLDGFELARKIRGVSKHVPIIFLTAKSMQEDKMEGFLLGGDEYVTKPYSFEELKMIMSFSGAGKSSKSAQGSARSENMHSITRTWISPTAIRRD